MNIRKMPKNICDEGSYCGNVLVLNTGEGVADNMSFDALLEPTLNGRQLAHVLGIDVRELRKRQANGCAPPAIEKDGLQQWPASVVRQYLGKMARENGWEVTDLRLCLAETKLNRMCSK